MTARARTATPATAKPASLRPVGGAATLDLFTPAPHGHQVSRPATDGGSRLPMPVEVVPPPAWAVEAGTAPPTVLAPPRDFEAAVERVRSDRYLVVRQRDASGHHLYQAYERTSTAFYNVTLDELAWGRIDTRRDVAADPRDDLRAAIGRQIEREAEARTVIRLLCPETERRVVRTDDDGKPVLESATASGVYERPDGILITSNPARRYAPGWPT